MSYMVSFFTISGRGFMKSSLEIHLGKCAEKFLAESEQYGIK